MRPRVEPTSSVHPTFEYVDGAVAVLEQAGEAETPAPAAVTDAQQAVEVVLRAVDRVAGREQNSVKLEFSVGDADLVVRVELRADEVRTTFRTDSPELRAALAQEWQAVSGSGESSVRLAPAVFSGSDQTGTESFSRDSSSGQHGRHASHGGENAGVPFAFRSSSTQPNAGTAAAPAAAPATVAPLGTARRLNLFA